MFSGKRKELAKLGPSTVLIKEGVTGYVPFMPILSKKSLLLQKISEDNKKMCVEPISPEESKFGEKDQ